MVTPARKSVRQKRTEEIAPRSAFSSRSRLSDRISKNTKADFKDLDLEETNKWLEEIGLETYRAAQIRQWVFRRQAESFEEMTNLSKELRGFLSSHATISRIKTLETEIARDGTKKFLFGLDDGATIESVLIPERTHYTACISSQVGCAMGCKFCLTARQGLTRDLTGSEIINQILQIRQAMEEPEKLTNIVFMGMGEPLLNYESTIKAVRLINNEMGIGPRNITISAVGIVPRILKLATEKLQVTLAVSLHAPNDNLRERLIPSMTRWSINEILNASREYIKQTGRRVTFEYCMLDKINDGVSEAKELAKILKSLNCHINLIQYNPVSNLPFNTSPQKQVRVFREILHGAGIQVTQRLQRRVDIDAACGQLRQQIYRSNLLKV